MKAFFISFLISILIGCNQTGKVHDPESKFNEIEEIVGNANWQFIDDNDTSYIYFSRTGNVHINVYRYQIVKGDSAGTQMNNIIHQHDSVIWNWGNEKLLMAAINGNSIQWEKMGSGNATFSMQRTDSLHMVFVFPDGHKATMIRTLPLSAFLIRRQYDYKNSTSYTDSAEVRSRR